MTTNKGEDMENIILMEETVFDFRIGDTLDKLSGFPIQESSDEILVGRYELPDWVTREIFDGIHDCVIEIKSSLDDISKLYDIEISSIKNEYDFIDFVYNCMDKKNIKQNLELMKLLITKKHIILYKKLFWLFCAQIKKNDITKKKSGILLRINNKPKYTYLMVECYFSGKIGPPKGTHQKHCITLDEKLCEARREFYEETTLKLSIRDRVNINNVINFKGITLFLVDVSKTDFDNSMKKFSFDNYSGEITRMIIVSDIPVEYKEKLIRTKKFIRGVLIE